MGIATGPLLALVVLVVVCVVAFWRVIALALVAAFLGLLCLGLLDVAVWMRGLR